MKPNQNRRLREIVGKLPIQKHAVLQPADQHHPGWFQARAPGLPLRRTSTPYRHCFQVDQGTVKRRARTQRAMKPCPRLQNSAGSPKHFAPREVAPTNRVLGLKDPNQFRFLSETDEAPPPSASAQAPQFLLGCAARDAPWLARPQTRSELRHLVGAESDKHQSESPPRSNEPPPRQSFLRYPPRPRPKQGGPVRRLEE